MTPLNQKVVETLYTEALMLADEARAAFQDTGRHPAPHRDDLTQMALSIEALRTTTRIMHMLAWLLNQRAFFSGELSAKQLDAFGRLPEDRAPDPEQLIYLPLETQELIARSEQLHAQITRLEMSRLQAAPANDRGTINDIRGKLAAAFGA